MNIKRAGRTEKAKPLSRKAEVLLAGVLAAAGASMALALWQPLAIPGGPAASAASVYAPEAPLSRERFDDQRFLTDRRSAADAVLAAIKRQDELRDQWLERDAMPSVAAGPARGVSLEERTERAQQRALDAAAAAAARRDADFGQAWLDPRPIANGSVAAPIRRDEDFGDAWLDPRPGANASAVRR